MHWMSAQHQLILDLLKRRGELTIDEIVTEIQLSKNATRSHLLNLEKLGLLKRVKMTSEQPGRPPVSFRISDQGQSLFPKSDSEILTALLHFLKERNQGELLEAFFREIWELRHQEYTQELKASALEAPGQDISARLQALETVLANSHFMPKVEVTEDRENGTTRVCIKECNCPFSASVKATRIPCRLETEFLADVIGTYPETTSFASNDQEHCLFAFELSDE